LTFKFKETVRTYIKQAKYQIPADSSLTLAYFWS